MYSMVSIELDAATEEVRRVSVSDSVTESVTNDTDPVLRFATPASRC